MQVKPEKSDSTKRHEDMIRLTIFCKDALEIQSSKVKVAVQVIGKRHFIDHLCNFLFSLYTCVHVGVKVLCLGNQKDNGLNQKGTVPSYFKIFIITTHETFIQNHMILN